MNLFIAMPLWSPAPSRMAYLRYALGTLILWGLLFSGALAQNATPEAVSEDSDDAIGLFINPDPTPVLLENTALTTSSLSTVPSPRTYFRIGYHARTSQADLTPAFYEAMAAALERDPSIQAALQAAGYPSDRIDALRAEDHVSLIRRMNQNEFDLVFCSALAFVEQKGDYRAIFQTYSANRRDSQSVSGVRRWGLAVVSRKHPILRGPGVNARFVRNARAAVVSNHSAAGYLYPMKALRSKFGAMPRDLIFCDSSDEVAKFVINGLVDIGLLDEKGLFDVAAQIPGRPAVEDLVSVEARAPALTDPVLLRTDLLRPKTELQPALFAGISTYCEERGNDPIKIVNIGGGIRVDSPLGIYEEVLEELRALEGDQP